MSLVGGEQHLHEAGPYVAADVEVDVGEGVLFLLAPYACLVGSSASSCCHIFISTYIKVLMFLFCIFFLFSFIFFFIFFNLIHFHSWQLFLMLSLSPPPQICKLITIAPPSAHLDHLRQILFWVNTHLEPTLCLFQWWGPWPKFTTVKVKILVRLRICISIEQFLSDLLHLSLSLTMKSPCST